MKIDFRGCFVKGIDIAIAIIASSFIKTSLLSSIVIIWNYLFIADLGWVFFILANSRCLVFFLCTLNFPSLADSTLLQNIDNTLK